MEKIVIRVHHKLTKKLYKHWSLLWEESNYSHPFNSPQWFQACLKAFGYKKTYIFCLYYDKKLFALLPLIEKRDKGFRVLCCPGGKYLDKSSLLYLYCEKKLILKLFKRILRESDLLLEELSDLVAECINQNFSSVKSYESSINYYIPGDDFTRFISKKRRKKLEKYLRKYSSGLEYTYNKGADKIIEKLFNIEKNSIRRKYGKGTFDDEKAKILYSNFIHNYKRNVRIDFLKYKNKSIAYKFGVIHNKIYYSFNTAYVDGYQFLTPGFLLNYLAFNNYSKDGLHGVDWLRGDNNLKSTFTPFFNRQYNLLYSRNKFKLLYWKKLNDLENWIKNQNTIYGFYQKIKVIMDRRGKS